MGKNKATFEVEENETISGCLDRMKSQGYTPVKRVEKPVFKEVKIAGKTEYEPAGRKIVFEGMKND
ncbi:NETI motif-containing protein [Peribacillus kribbensis]|uniref:NETI motif-containing protein n=1 Tax=Peribacillus kribbensis TaxID=356658 RepID=UPI00041BBD55|nr:NETI motif-containing protein [Peribacillus kribbensis]